jgi:hypothetical protein
LRVSTPRNYLSFFLDCFIGFRFVRLHQLVSEPGFLSMAPVTRKGGNRYASLHDVYERSDSVHEDLEATPEGHEEDLQAALRAQIEDLTCQLDESRLYDIRRRRRTPPSRRKRTAEATTVMELQTLLRSAERRAVDPLRKLMLIGGRAGSSWIFQNSQGVCNLRNFWIG